MLEIDNLSNQILAIRKCATLRAGILLFVASLIPNPAFHVSLSKIHTIHKDKDGKHKPKVLLAAGASENVRLTGASENVLFSVELSAPPRSSEIRLGGALDRELECVLLLRLGDLERRLGDLERRLGERDRLRGDRERFLGDRLRERLLLGLRDRERRDLRCDSSNCLISS